MASPTVPAPATCGPMIYGYRRYSLAVVEDDLLVTYDFNDETGTVEMRLAPPSDGSMGVFKDMASGIGSKAITAILECGNTPDEIEVHVADQEKLDLLRRSIEWFYADEMDSMHRKVLRMFYTRVRKALG